MPNFFYLDQNNQKQGPVTDQQLKALAAQGVINPNTPLATDGGHKGTAGQIPGLFAASPSPFTQATQAVLPHTNVFCTNCGNPIAEHAVACMSCGAQPVGHKKFCRRCGVTLNPEQVICIKCGAAVAANNYQPQQLGGYQSQVMQSSGGFWDFWSLKPNAPLRSRSIYVLIALCLGGGIGMHNVYAGRSKVAMLQLIIGVLGLLFVFPTVVVYFWAIVDCFNVKEDGLGRPFI